MKFFVGTSGWYYDWNNDLNLDWYINNSKLNAVELNASFYRFPFPNQIKSWVKKGENLRWAIKVSRLITHQFKFSEKGIEVWQRFYDLFSAMEDLIDYYLFQLPPRFTAQDKDKIAQFLSCIRTNEKIALEFRNASWFKEDIVKWAESLRITIVSIDAPGFPQTIFNTSKSVYLRMHGRTSWYAHDYTIKELKEVARKISQVHADRVYVFFNNNHNMLKNAQDMIQILNRI
ncbi:MAG: DUF72 domain-containing protein [bacterium]